LPDSLLGRSCCSVMRDSLAEFREHVFTSLFQWSTMSSWDVKTRFDS
jgi:hypothetical protein